ncbi:MAG: FtsX-like permease family protein [Candidatus Thorarchaeota archaeon]
MKWQFIAPLILVLVLGILSSLWFEPRNSEILPAWDQSTRETIQATNNLHKKPQGIFSLDALDALVNQHPLSTQATETLRLIGKVNNVENRTQPLVNVSILAFFLKNPAQYTSNLFEIFTTLGFNTTLPPEPSNFSSAGTFSFQFQFTSIRDHLEKYPYFAYLVFPGSNVTILNLKERYTGQNEINLGTIHAYSFADLGILGISGISHINSTIPESRFLARPNFSATEGQYCAPFTYQALDNQTGQLLLDVPAVFVKTFSSIIPLEDFFFWLPKNRILDVRFIFYTADVGWVDETWTFNTTYEENSLPFSYHLLSLDVAKKAIETAEDRFQELEADGINLDHYRPALKDAQLSQQRSLEYWKVATPNITYSGSLQFFDLGDMGFQALFEAEMAIIQAQRAEKLANLYFESLAAQPTWISAMTILILATIIAILASQALADTRYLSITIRVLIFLVLIGTAYLTNPLLKIYLESEKFALYEINIPIIAIMLSIFSLAAIGTLFIPSFRILEKPRTFLTLSIRNLRRRKSRTLITFLTLGIAISSFVLIVSNNYEVDVIAKGEKADYDFDNGILIENHVAIPLQGSLQLQLTKRIETIANVTLQIYGEGDAALAKRYYSTSFGEEPEITLSSPFPQENWTHQLRNLLAISPSQEERITKLQARFQTEGRWLATNSSDILLSEALRKKIGIAINETLLLTYNASGTILSLPLTVSGIFADELDELRNVNGKQIAPPNLNASRPCNSTEFVVLDFEYWRVQFAQALSASTLISVSEAPPTQILLGTTNLEIARELADRLEQQKIVMGKNGIVYSLRVSFFGKTEGVIPQIIPLLISCLVIYQIILNSVWERQQEIRVYGTLGLSDRGIKALFSTEYIILGIICGGVAYYFGLILFPVIKAANIESSFLSQKTDAIFAVLSVLLAVAVCALAAIPAITRAYVRIATWEKIEGVERLDDALELPVRFDEADRPLLETHLSVIPFFQDASFDSQGIALGEKGAQIGLKMANGMISAILSPGKLSMKQIKQIKKNWLELGLKRRSN